MNEQNNIQNNIAADDITTKVIIQRLAERRRKMQFMHDMDKKHSSRIILTRTIPLLVIAACLLVVFLVTPLWRSSTSPLDELGIQPDITAVRAADPAMTEIASLIERQDYSRALTRTKRALENSDYDIKQFTGMWIVWEDTSDPEYIEQLRYEEQQLFVANSELRWTYIYLLVRENQTKEACKQLRKYLKDKDYCDHREEAEQLLERLKN